MSLNQIKGIIQKNMSILRSRYGVKSLGVFGSVSRGEEKKESDVDVLVEFSVTPGFLNLSNWKNF